MQNATCQRRRDIPVFTLVLVDIVRLDRQATRFYPGLAGQSSGSAFTARRFPWRLIVGIHSLACSLGESVAGISEGEAIHAFCHT